MKTALATIFAAIAMLVVVGVLIIHWIGDQTMLRQTEVLMSRSAIDRLNTTLSTLKDAETGQRGYLLTQDEGYLAPFENAKGQIDEELARLSRSLTSGERTSPDFDQLVQLTTRKLNELQKTVDLAHHGNLDQALEIVRSGEGKDQMDQIRDRAARIEEREQRRLETAQRALERADIQRNAIFFTVAAVNLVFIAWAYRRIRHETIVRANALTEIERQKDLLSVTLLSIGDAVIITDVEGRIVLMNKVAEGLTGWRLQEAKTMPCEAVFRIINEETRQTVESPVIKVLREGVIAGLANHTLLVKRDGTETPIDDSGAPIRDSSGELRGVVLVFRDFTNYKIAEQGLRDARDELDAANRAKNQFFATLSHELRTPLTPVMATLSLWESDISLSESMRGDVQMMRRNIEMETRLIDELIDLNRILKGKVSLKLEVADVHELISSVLRMYSSEIYSRGVTVATHFAAQRHYVNCDLDRLQQVFWNILRNAAVNSPNGGHINVQSFNDGSSVCIAFRDTGIGMSPETIQKLFKPFEGNAHENPGLSEGLGLGLSISRALIVQQRGEITASSPGLGLGSEFLVRLPSEQQNPQPATVANSPTTIAAGSSKRLRILLAEDHVDSATAMARMLSHFGHEVDTAGSSAAALGLYRQRDYDLVLSDIGLPDGNGLDLVRKMKETRDVPAIALTGFGTEEDIVQSQKSGFVRHLTKPVNFQQLKEAIEQLFSRKGSG